jgi:hypothetical protein
MRAINVLLAILVSMLLGLGILEGGLRLLGKGPAVSMLEFDPQTGWSKKPGFTQTKRTAEFSAHFEINELGLRDDPMDSPAKPAGTYRVVALGDSFTLGFSVERDQLFVDLLEQAWRSEGRPIEVLNAGTEGWDTAQQAAWLEANAGPLAPDLVLLLPYENDLYWNSQAAYQTADGPRPKPRYDADGTRENPTLEEPAPRAWHQNFAVTRWLGKPDSAGRAAHAFQPAGASRPVEKELAPLLAPRPALMDEVEARTTGALRALEAAAAGVGAELVVVPIPAAPRSEAAWKGIYEQARGLAGLDWSCDRPVDLLLGMAGELGLAAIDVRPALDAAAAAGPIYYKSDWHFNEAGNRAFADAIRVGLDGAASSLPPSTQAGALPPVHEESEGLPGWLALYLVLFVGLTGLYWSTYGDEPRWAPPLKVGALLAAIFAIFLGVGRLPDLVPATVAQWMVPTFVVVVLGVVLYYLGGKIKTIAELTRAFILRGHWYLMPLLVVLLTIGSLLVVAASNPFVAPFIYTLF